MLKYLNRLQRKKGFTVVELVVVIALIGILTAIIMTNLIGGNTDKILSANTAASVFLTSTQLTFTRAHLTERSIVNYPTVGTPLETTKYIEYKNGENTTGGKYLFVEVYSSKRGIQYLHIDNTITALMSQSESRDMTLLEKYLMTEEENRMSDSYEGYFYALIDTSFRVKYTYYAEYRFPVYSASTDPSAYSAYRDKLMFSPAFKLANGNGFVGMCSDATTYGEVGTFVFEAPASGDVFKLIFGE